MRRGCAVRAIALAELRRLKWNRPIVVERRSPQHGAVRHHAGLNFTDFGGMTARRATGLFRNPQVAGIDEADVVPVFAQPVCIGSFGVRGRTCVLGIPWLRMRLALGLQVVSRIRRTPWGHLRASLLPP